MTSWIALPRFNTTVNSRAFEQLVENCAAHDDGALSQDFAEQALGMQHIRCIGPDIGRIAPALLHAITITEGLFGSNAPRRLLSQLDCRLSSLVRDHTVVPHLVGASPRVAPIHVRFGDRVAEVDPYILGVVLAATGDPDRHRPADVAGSGQLLLDPDQVAALAAATDEILGDPTARSLGWSDQSWPLGDYRQLCALRVLVDPEWQPPTLVVAESVWANPIAVVLPAATAASSIRNAEQAVEGSVFTQVAEQIYRFDSARYEIRMQAGNVEVVEASANRHEQTKPV